MGGCGNFCAINSQPLQNGDSQCGTLYRVSTGAKLVQQNEAVAVRFLDDGNGVCHVCGEGGKALLNALLVTDVHQHFFEHVDGAVFVGRNHQAAHCHQGQQTDGFQSNGLTAGVRAGDHESIKFFAQSYVGGNDLFRVDQRMAGFFQFKLTVVHQIRHGGFHLVSQCRFGEVQVDLHQQVIAVNDGLSVNAHFGGKLGYNALDLPLFFGLQNLNFIVCFHNSHRLDENGSAAGGGIVNETLYLTAVFGFDRHNEAAVTLCNDVFLQIFALTANHAVQLVTNAKLCLIDLAANIAQLLAGGIGNFLIGHNSVADGVFQAFVRAKHFKKLVQRGLGSVTAVSPILYGADVGQYGCHLQQLAQGEIGAFFCSRQRFTAVFQPMYGWSAKAGRKHIGIRGLFHQGLCLI